MAEPELEVTKAPVRALVLDFDGVVLESAEIKTEAFAEVFAHLPEHRDAIVAYHLANVGMSRYEKFDWIYAELLGAELPADERARLGERFSAIALERILRCPFVSGAREALARLAGRLPLYVASGTPADELAAIVAERGLAGTFAAVWGSPVSKMDALRQVREREDLAGDEVLFVGDAESDLAAAEAAGVRFVARAKAAERPAWEERAVPVVEDLRELLPLVLTTTSRVP